MVVLPGAPAFTNARLAKLVASTLSANPGIGTLLAHHVHFLEHGETASHADTERLNAILGIDALCTVPSGALFFIVSPRVGTRDDGVRAERLPKTWLNRRPGLEPRRIEIVWRAPSWRA